MSFVHILQRWAVERFFWLAFCVFLGLFPLMSRAAEVIPNDPLYGREWAMRQIGAPEAWSVSTGSRSVVVAVIDAGVDLSHPDLAQNIWTNLGEIPNDGIDNDANGYIDDVHGWNFVNNTSTVSPIYNSSTVEEAWDHGTLVSSLIAAKGNDGYGIAGVAWNVRVMPLVVLDAGGYGSMQSIVKAIRYAVNKGVSVINLSLVGYDSDPELEQAIKEAYRAGVLVVAATGNDEIFPSGVDLDQTPAYPVCTDGDANYVLGVGGSDPLDQRSPYANYGRKCMDLVAPSMDLIGARPTLLEPGATSSKEYVEGLSGTSLAAPLVSGAAALVKSVNPEWNASQIRDYLLITADPVEFLVATGEGRIYARRLNIGRALSQLKAQRETVLPLVHTDIRSTTTSTKFTWTKGTQVRSLTVTGTMYASYWREDPRFGWEAQALYKDAQGKIRVRVWRPETQTDSNEVLAIDGKTVWSALTLIQGIYPKSVVFTSLKTGSAYIWRVETRELKPIYPYGSGYKGGVQAFRSPDTSHVLLWPTVGGGNASLMDAAGAITVRTFPFGKNVVGTWRLKAIDAKTIDVVGPNKIHSKFIWDIFLK